MGRADLAHQVNIQPSGAEQHHKPELDGIRGIAILAVLGSHVITVMQVLPWTASMRVLNHILIPGWAGVDLFFVLSGFLITGILLRTKTAPSYYFRSFYWRRILRIFPIYYSSLIVLLMIGHFSRFFHSALPSSLIYRVSYFLFMQNWPAFWGGRFLDNNLLGSYWSLAVEEQFYLLWPILILKISERKMMRLCITGLILAPILRILLVKYVYGTNFALMELTTSRMDGLLAGSFCALYTHSQRKLLPLRWISSAMAVGATTLTFIVVKTSGSELIGTGKYMHTIGVTGFALLSSSLVALSQYRFRWLQQPLCAGWLRAMGKYSYGIYIYHAFIFFGMRQLLTRIPHRPDPLPFFPALIWAISGVLLAIGVAKVSFDLFESRFLALKKYFQPLAPGKDLTQSTTPRSGEEAVA